MPIIFYLKCFWFRFGQPLQQQHSTLWHCVLTPIHKCDADHWLWLLFLLLLLLFSFYLCPCRCWCFCSWLTTVSRSSPVRTFCSHLFLMWASFLLLLLSTILLLLLFSLLLDLSSSSVVEIKINTFTRNLWKKGRIWAIQATLWHFNTIVIWSSVFFGLGSTHFLVQSTISTNNDSNITSHFHCIHETGRHALPHSRMEKTERPISLNFSAW